MSENVIKCSKCQIRRKMSLFVIFVIICHIINVIKCHNHVRKCQKKEAGLLATQKKEAGLLSTQMKHVLYMSENVRNCQEMLIHELVIYNTMLYFVRKCHYMTCRVMS